MRTQRQAQPGGGPAQQQEDDEVDVLLVGQPPQQPQRQDVVGADKGQPQSDAAVDGEEVVPSVELHRQRQPQVHLVGKEESNEQERNST